MSPVRENGDDLLPSSDVENYLIQVKKRRAAVFYRSFHATIVRVKTATDNLKANKARYLKWIDEIDRVRHEIALTGSASATISAGGGSKSYTNLDLDKLAALRADYVRRVREINRTLRYAGMVGHLFMTRI